MHKFINTKMTYEIMWKLYIAAKHGGSPADKENFVTLLSEMRSAFDPHNLMLTASVSRDREIMEAGYDIPALYKYVTHCISNQSEIHWKPFDVITLDYNRTDNINRVQMITLHGFHFTVVRKVPKNFVLTF